MINWIKNKIEVMTKNNVISKTKAVKLIEGTKGKFFTVTWKKNNGDLRMVNGNFKSGNMTRTGYLRVWSAKDKGYRQVNPRTITHLSVSGVEYKVR